MTVFQSKELFLLTGAGFSKNCGGYLSDEMWAKIYNYPKLRTSANLLQLLRTNFDFEEVYATVISAKSSFSEDDRKLLNEAIRSAYSSLDQSEIDYLGSGDSHATQRLKRFIGEILHGSRDEKALWFTLNQDLLVERMWDGQYRSLGVQAFGADIYQMRRALAEHEFVKLSSNIDDATKGFGEAAQFHYLKLHGSIGWWTSYEESSTPQMVIGTSKEEFIDKEPILKFYYNLFRTALNQGKKKLLIIGYGFRDEHVNRIILDATRDKNAGLELFVINSTKPKDFRRDHPEFWENMLGYFPYTFHELFPNRDQVEKPTQPLQEVLDALK